MRPTHRPRSRIALRMHEDVTGGETPGRVHRIRNTDRAVENVNNRQRCGRRIAVPNGNIDPESAGRIDGSDMASNRGIWQ